MNRTLFIGWSLILFVSATIADTWINNYVVVEKNSVGAYSDCVRALYQKSLFQLTIDQRYRITSENDECVQVRNSEGVAGWIKKNEVHLLAASRAHVFDQASVEGYGAFPSFGCVEGDRPDSVLIIMPSRSFFESVTVNVDREVIARFSSSIF